MNYSLIIGMYGFMIFTVLAGTFCLFQKQYEAAYMVFFMSVTTCAINIMVDISPDVNSPTPVFVLDVVFCAMIVILSFYCMFKHTMQRKRETAWMTEKGVVTVLELKERIDNLVKDGYSGRKVVMYDGITYHYVGRNVAVGKDTVCLG